MQKNRHKQRRCLANRCNGTACKPRLFQNRGRTQSREGQEHRRVMGVSRAGGSRNGHGRGAVGSRQGIRLMTAVTPPAPSLRRVGGGGG